MTTHQDARIEAAAKALFESNWATLTWRRVPGDMQQVIRDAAKDALVAADAVEEPEAERLRTENDRLGTLVAILWRPPWKINGEGDAAHLNNGKGVSYGDVTDNDNRVLFTSSQMVETLRAALAPDPQKGTP